MPDPALVWITVVYTGIVSFVPYKDASKDAYAVLVQDASAPPMDEGTVHLATLRVPLTNYRGFAGNLIKLEDDVNSPKEFVGFDLRGFDVHFERGATPLQSIAAPPNALVINRGCPAPRDCGKFRPVQLDPNRLIDPSLAARAWVTSGSLTAPAGCITARFEHEMPPLRPISQEVINEFSVPVAPDYTITLKKGTQKVGTITLAPDNGEIEITISNTLPSERFGAKPGQPPHPHESDAHVKLFFAMSDPPVDYTERKGLVVQNICAVIATPNGSNCPPGFWNPRPETRSAAGIR